MEIVQFPNEILTKKVTKICAENLDENLAFARAISDVMLGRKNCAGLSANQCGIDRRFFVMRDGMSGVRYCFDPVIISHGRELVANSEGCMSLGWGDRSRGGIFVPVPRWRVITGEYTNERGNRITQTFKGMEARVWQHEIDHLNGLMIIKTGD